LPPFVALAPQPTRPVAQAVAPGRENRLTTVIATMRRYWVYFAVYITAKYTQS
jgi:hypothetical protein